MTATDDPGSRLGLLTFGPLVEASRRLLDAATAADPPPNAALKCAVDINNIAAELETFAVDEMHAQAGQRADLPGYGQPVLLPFIIDQRSTDKICGRVTFRRAHLGYGGAVHGGTSPLLFDKVLGRLVAFGRTAARTAYLHVNYRQLTPVGVELEVAARITSVTGRKILVTGELAHEGTTLADAEGLFVSIRPGRPRPVATS